MKKKVISEHKQDSYIKNSSSADLHIGGSRLLRDAFADDVAFRSAEHHEAALTGLPAAGEVVPFLDRLIAAVVDEDMSKASQLLNGTVLLVITRCRGI